MTLVLRSFFRDPYEPNDAFEEAWGPQSSGQVYRAYFPSESDPADHYFFEVPDTHKVEIW